MFSLALRPESLRLCAKAEEALPNKIPGVISKVSYLGQLYEVLVRTEKIGDLMVTMPLGGARPQVGEMVHVGWSIESGMPMPGRPDGMDDAYAG